MLRHWLNANYEKLRLIFSVCFIQKKLAFSERQSSCYLAMDLIQGGRKSFSHIIRIYISELLSWWVLSCRGVKWRSLKWRKRVLRCWKLYCSKAKKICATHVSYCDVLSSLPSETNLCVRLCEHICLLVSLVELRKLKIEKKAPKKSLRNATLEFVLVLIDLPVNLVWSAQVEMLI